MAELKIDFAKMADGFTKTAKEKGMFVGWWIPVSEKLPEDGTYLVTVERTTGKPRVEVMSFAKDLNKVDDYDFPKHKCGWYDYDSEYGYWEDTDVIAWMPLPQPYDPQESEE